MIAAIAPHPHQIRYYAQLALSGFDTLGADAAVQNAKDELNALLDYLGRFADYAVPILGAGQIEPWVVLEGAVSDAEAHDLADLKRTGTNL